jgi:hypothetical protein
MVRLTSRPSGAYMTRARTHVKRVWAAQDWAVQYAEWGRL